MACPVCAKCGQGGASYCSVVSENGEPAGDWFHPICFASNGASENVHLQRRGRGGRSPVPQRPKGPVRQVRAPVGQTLQPVQREVRGLSPQTRGVQGNGKRQCL